MSNDCLYEKIDEMIKDKRFDDKIRRETAEKERLIDELLKGNREGLFRKLEGSYAKNCNEMTDSELLAVILQSCSEEVLLGLEREFGRKSKISEIIREKMPDISQPKRRIDEETITSLENMLKESEKMNSRLYSLICKHLEERGYKSDADFYKSISMSRQNFARIRNKSVNVGKESVLWIACGLGLSYIEAYQILNAAGYTFKANDKRDMVIEYIMKNVPNYTLDTVNDILYHFGLRTFFDK